MPSPDACSRTLPSTAATLNRSSAHAQKNRSTRCNLKHPRTHTHTLSILSLTSQTTSHFACWLTQPNPLLPLTQPFSSRLPFKGPALPHLAPPPLQQRASFWLPLLKNGWERCCSRLSFSAPSLLPFLRSPLTTQSKHSRKHGKPGKAAPARAYT